MGEKARNQLIGNAHNQERNFYFETKQNTLTVPSPNESSA